MNTGTIKPPDERIAALRAEVEAYEERNAVPRPMVPGPEGELTEYLTMDRKVLAKKTGEDCAEIACRLAQFSLYIQRLINEEKADLGWANAVMNDVCAGQLGNYDKYMKHEVKMSLIVKENSYAANVYKIILEIQGRISRLEHLARSIGSLADKLERLQFAKNATIKQSGG